MSAHTPGPWRLWVSVNDNDNNAGAFMLRGDSPMPHGKDMVIAKRDCGTPNPAEGIANAHLIAAAPDLLAALKQADTYTSLNVVTPPTQATSFAVLEAIRAAIAKAEGR